MVSYLQLSGSCVTFIFIHEKKTLQVSFSSGGGGSKQGELQVTATNCTNIHFSLIICYELLIKVALSFHDSHITEKILQETDFSSISRPAGSGMELSRHTELIMILHKLRQCTLHSLVRLRALIKISMK